MSNGRIAIYGQELTRKELLQRVGDMSQIADIPDFDGGCGYGVYFCWMQATMPYLAIWKMLGEKHYVIGLEIGNATAEGRAANREAGILRSLETDELVETNVEIGVLSGPEEIEAWKDKHA